MKQENLDKVKDAIKDEFGVNDTVAEFAAKSAMEGVKKALMGIVNKVITGDVKSKT